MKYRNNKTGVLIETPCRISGGDWQRVDDKKSTPAKRIKKTPAKKTAMNESEAGAQ